MEVKPIQKISISATLRGLNPGESVCFTPASKIQTIRSAASVVNTVLGRRELTVTSIGDAVKVTRLIMKE